MKMLIAIAVCTLLTLPQDRAHAQTALATDTAIEATVYKSTTCGCCSKWVEHLKSHGFNVVTKDEDDMQVIKEKYNVPHSLQSCHTALIGGYVIEGHVGADVIRRLLAERPDVVGIAAPGMPIGSPGMEVNGRAPTPHDIIALTRDGRTSVFAKR